MPGAIDGVVEGTGWLGICSYEDPHSDMASYCNAYVFHIKASSADISAYYEQQMQILGWKSENGSNENGIGVLLFSNGSHTLTISILPNGSEGDINEVELSLD